MTEHSITPPPHLIEQWMQDHSTKYALSRQAAQWGADQELEACLDQLQRWGIQGVDNLRNTRRPKPPSLKEQALAALHGADDQGLSHEHVVTIRRALEQLDD
jgi:hypothetical protein